MDREQLLAGLENVSASHADLIKAINDPGDYECEHCRRRSLLRNARRCIKCHGVIPLSFWQEIDERERKAREERKRIQEETARQEEQRLRDEELQRIAQAKRKSDEEAYDLLFKVIAVCVSMVLFGVVLWWPKWVGTAKPYILYGETPTLDLDGTCDYLVDLDNETVTLTVGRIANFGQHSRSGSLRLQLYFAEQPDVKRATFGLLVIDKGLKPLDAGESILGVDVQKELPDEFWKARGVRYPVLVLTEYIDDTTRKIHRYKALRLFSITAKKSSKWWKFWSEFEYSIELGPQPP